MERSKQWYISDYNKNHESKAIRTEAKNAGIETTYSERDKNGKLRPKNIDIQVVIDQLAQKKIEDYAKNKKSCMNGLLSNLPIIEPDPNYRPSNNQPDINSKKKYFYQLRFYGYDHNKKTERIYVPPLLRWVDNEYAREMSNTLKYKHNLNFHGTPKQLQTYLAKLVDVVHGSAYFAPFYNEDDKSLETVKSSTNNRLKCEFDVITQQEEGSTLLTLKRGKNVINYVPQQATKSTACNCFIAALEDCNYTRGGISKHFKNAYKEDFMVSAEEILEFIAIYNGRAVFYNLFSDVILDTKNQSTYNTNYRVLTGYLNHEHFTTINDTNLKQSLQARTDKFTNKRSGFKSLIGVPMEITKEIISIEDNEDMLQAILTCTINGNIQNYDDLPEIKFYDNSVSYFEAGDKVYSCLSEKEIDSMRKFNDGKKTLDTRAAFIYRTFSNFCVKNDLSVESQESPLIRDLLNSFPIGAKFYQLSENQAEKAIDMNKCYSHLFKSIRIFRSTVISKVNVIDINESTQYSEDVVKPGMYSVQTDDKYLFRGNGMYTDQVVLTAIKYKIPFKSEFYINFDAQKTNKFEEFVDQLFAKYGDVDANKCIGQLIGCCNKKHIPRSRTIITFEKKEVFEYYAKYGASVRVITPKEKNIITETTKYRELYLITKEDKSERFVNQRGIYMEIINNSYIQSYLTMRMIGLENLSYIGTDALGASYLPEHIEAGLNASKVGDYKSEKPKAHKVIPEFKNRDIIPLPPTTTYTRTVVEELGPYSTFVQGRAGSGKTTLIKNFLKDKKAIILGPTNACSRIIKGKTLDSYFSSNFCSLSQAMIDDISTYEYIFVDEASMLNREHWLILCIVKYYTPAIHFIIGGDFAQLSPVLDDLDFYNSDMFKYLTPTELNLTKIHRYNFDYDKVDLNGVHEQNLDVFLNMKSPRAVVITNWRRRQLIAAALKKLNIEDGEYAKGMPLICKSNLRFASKEIVYDDGYTPLKKCKAHYNNEEYRILDIYELGKTTMIKMINMTAWSTRIDSDPQDERDYIEEYTVEHVNARDKDNKRKNFEYGYAQTTYSVQGRTFDFEYVIFESKDMGERHKYVAVTRAKDIALILNATESV